MGLKLYQKGNPQTHLDHRLAQAFANWARLWGSTTSWKGTPWQLRFRIYEATYLKSCTWAVGCFPEARSVLPGFSTAVLRPLPRQYGKKRHESVGDWWKRTHRSLRRLRYQGHLRHPMHEVTAQWTQLSRFIQAHQDHALSRIIRWRGTDWHNGQIPRNLRPMRRQGQFPQHLQTVIEHIAESPSVAIDLIIKYVSHDYGSPPPWGLPAVINVTTQPVAFAMHGE